MLDEMFNDFYRFATALCKPIFIILAVIIFDTSTKVLI